MSFPVKKKKKKRKKIRTSSRGFIRPTGATAKGFKEKGETEMGDAHLTRADSLQNGHNWPVTDPTTSIPSN